MDPFRFVQTLPVYRCLRRVAARGPTAGRVYSASGMGASRHERAACHFIGMIQSED
jgi:hypothetical protein